MARKTSRGRQRIAMEKIQNESSLQVTFSKRRSGIVKKCNELSTFTGAEMAVVIFSPGNKAISFGNPFVETILNRFQNPQIPNNDHLTERSFQLHQEDKLKDLAERIDLLKDEHEAERKLKGLMDQLSEIEEKNNNLCLEASVENLNKEQLQKLKNAFQELNKMAEKKVETQNTNLEIQKETSFHASPNIENAHGGYIPTFPHYAVSRNVIGFPSHVYANATFGGNGFHFIPGGGGASSSINNGVQMNVPPLETTVTATAPAVVGFVLPHYAPIQGYLPLF